MEVDASETGGVGAILAQQFGEKPKLQLLPQEVSPAKQNFDLGNWELLMPESVSS